MIWLIICALSLKAVLEIRIRNWPSIFLKDKRLLIAVLSGVASLNLMPCTHFLYTCTASHTGYNYYHASLYSYIYKVSYVHSLIFVVLKSAQHD